MGQDYVIKKSTTMDFQETRRTGVREKKLVSSDESLYQNMILIDMEKGAEVELHKIHCHVFGSGFPGNCPDVHGRLQVCSLKSGGV
ncbi:MAG: hypothetical protein A2W28_05200 [Gammaproteobacteria bacterium RBG_16_51_14]|nr:MAG: hypothetical protein A2W28_05200 [Gammaproteobacteria bacterium RBG_16_51_14]